MSETHPSSPNYISYVRALALLKERLHATPAEVAAWLWLGPQHGGLSAYLSANELSDPPQFFFSTGGDDGDAYLEDLAHAWFCMDEIEAFRPSDRYITGADLRARWSYIPDKCGFSIDAYIMARIQESRLVDISPCTGLSQWSVPEKPWATSRTMALFCLTHVSIIEIEDPELHKIDQSASADAAPTETTDGTGRRTRCRSAVTAAIRSCLASYRERHSSTNPNKFQCWQWMQRHAPAGHEVRWSSDGKTLYVDGEQSNLQDFGKKLNYVIKEIKEIKAIKLLK